MCSLSLWSIRNELYVQKEKGHVLFIRQLFGGIWVHGMQNGFEEYSTVGIATVTSEKYNGLKAILMLGH